MRVPAPVNAPLRMGDIASLITSPAWLEWFQRLADYYEAVPRFIDPKSPYFGQAAPADPSEGLLAYADGTNWNPDGSGVAGIYTYISGAWLFSGALLPAATVSSETAFGVLAAVGTSLLYARADHTHGTPADPLGTSVFTDHSARHENGGADEISIAGLSGEAADAQPPKSHDNTAHSTAYQASSEKDSASGYAGLNSVSRTTKGVDTTDDLIVDLATKGLVLKDPQGTPHYWRGTISALGVLTFADLGTSKP